MTTVPTQSRCRLVDLPSVLEAERADIISDLERYFAMLTSVSATPIVQEIAAVLADDRLTQLHRLDTATDQFEIPEECNKETRR